MRAFHFHGSMMMAAALLASVGGPRAINAAPDLLPEFYPTPGKRPRRSRYMPHIGAKERARHAGKLDGPMHVTGHERRAELLKWIASH